MSSLNSQESSNDLSKLTDRQQAEYRSAYQDYISHMAQLEAGGSGTERAEDKAKDGEQEGRKPFKRNSKAGESVMDYSTTQDSGLLHPITEEDEKPERKPSVSRTKGPGPRYHSIPNEEDEECVPEETDATPLLWEEKQGEVQAKSFDSAGMDKKESSDSGMRSSGSSSNHSLQDEESEEAQEEDDKSKEEDLVTTIRMSICSEALSEASSPEENWATSRTHTQAVTNLNQAASNNSPLNNNNNGDERSLIISPGSSTGTRALLNHNLLTVRAKKSTNTTQDEGSEERESVL